MTFTQLVRHRLDLMRKEELAILTINEAETAISINTFYAKLRERITQEGYPLEETNYSYLRDDDKIDERLCAMPQN